MQNHLPHSPAPKKSGLSIALLIAIGLILISVVGFYFAVPLLGISLVVGATVWIAIIATIFVFSIALLLFFVIPGFLVFIISLFAFIWVLLAIVLFPILFPIIMPIFIILLFIAYIRRKQHPLN